MSNLNSQEERNARALEVAGRIVGELIGDVRLGMFDQRVSPAEREERRTQGAAEIADLTVKVAYGIVGFIR